MKLIRRTFWGHLVLAILCLAAGYGLLKLWGILVAFILLGMLWFVSQQRGAPMIASTLLFVFLLGDAIGLRSGFPGWLALLAAVGTLGAWDLDHFLRRLNAASRVAYESGLTRTHLQRLLLVEGLGSLTGLAGLYLHMRLSFWWEVVLVILTVVGISQIIEFVRRQVED